ncbi:MAG: carbonic anhydrase [Anaerolineaceae bacterium]
MGAKTAIELLMAGNRRFAEGRLDHPRQGIERRQEITTGQHPVAAVLCCSDSRVPPEIIFDQGLGDLFVIRNAGNILDDLVFGSLEYAVDHLHVPLIVVLGHEKCGAVTAAVQSLENHESHSGFIPRILAKITPAVKIAQGLPGNLVEQASLANAEKVATEIRTTPSLLTGKMESGLVEVHTAYYHLESGKVDFLSIQKLT